LNILYAMYYSSEVMRPVLVLDNRCLRGNCIRFERTAVL